MPGVQLMDTCVSRSTIMWNQLKSGALFSSLSLPAPSWWVGWSNAGPNVPIPRLPVIIRRGDLWTDVFLGEALTVNRHSLLDGKAKVALHYCTSDLEKIADMSCPSAEIPRYLWQSLQHKHSRSLFKGQRFHG